MSLRKNGWGKALKLAWYEVARGVRQATRHFTRESELCDEISKLEHRALKLASLERDPPLTDGELNAMHHRLKEFQDEVIKYAADGNMPDLLNKVLDWKSDTERRLQVSDPWGAGFSDSNLNRIADLTHSCAEVLFAVILESRRRGVKRQPQTI